MIQKKVCMIGSFAVGKTSLVARFVKSIFSEKYLTTVGAKIDKKMVRLGNQELTLILWDLHGDDEFQKVRTSYLQGSASYLLVADGTRRVTLDKALRLQKEAGGRSRQSSLCSHPEQIRSCSRMGNQRGNH
jgi:small GTP-binding protein